MEIGKHRLKVLKKVASHPGSHDRAGGPLLVIQPPIGNVNINGKSASTPDLGAVFFPYEDLVSVLAYFSSITPRDNLQTGFCLLIDARKTQPKALKNILRGCQQALYRKIRLVLIIQPDKFLHQQKMNMDIIMEGYEFKTVLLSMHKLSKFIDVSQLPESFGGTYPYDPDRWCEERERIEAVLHRLALRKLDFSMPGQESAPFSKDEETIIEAESLAADLSASSSSAVHSVRNAIEQVKLAASRPEREAEAQRAAEQQHEKAKMLEEHAEGVNRLLDWIEGPGEAWLLTLHEIGESKDEAKQLLKEHQQLANRSKEIRDQSAELGEMASRLMAACPSHSITLEKARDQVQFIAEQFEGRVQRQMKMVKRSEELHTILADFSRKTDLLLGSICNEPKIPDLISAEAERKQIEEKVADMERIYQTACENGGSFIDDLAAHEYNIMGKKITRNYAASICHIKEQLVSARERRRRCLDLVDVRRLSLQHLVQLYTTENDGNQVINWIEELHDNLLRDYNQIGCEERDLHCIRESRAKLQETARSHYDYGKELCSSAMVLRRSLRLNTQPTNQIIEKLEQIWGRLCRALADNEAKLHVTQSFNDAIVEINKRIEEIERQSRERLLPGRSIETVLASERRRLAGDIMELSHIRDLLTAQINANHYASVEARQSAIMGIRRKVESVEDRHRRMESLFKDTQSESDKEKKEQQIRKPEPPVDYPRDNQDPADLTSPHITMREIPTRMASLGGIQIGDAESYL